MVPRLGTIQRGHGGQIRQTRCITQRMPGDKRTQRISGRWPLASNGDILHITYYIYIILYCIVLYYITLHYIILYYIIILLYYK